MFEKVLIANRGEIACRVMRTCRRLGIATVAVYSQADAEALHVRMADEAVPIGPPPAAESYLCIERIVEAAQTTGTQAVHPGYGFLSENAAFAEALAAAGIVFIGPPPAAIRAMGDKIEAKRLAAAAGVSIVPGHPEAIADPALAARIAAEIGYPVMIKAAAGGGGKGMRIALDERDLREGLMRAQSEARSSFGDDRVFLERYVETPRHIEIQVLADGHGTVLYLGERECSIQRRHQKVIEEAPSPFLDAATRRAMGEQAAALARAVDYRSAGTVEFIVDGARNFYFLEMNTRLQVEHPVTEEITGQDLVEWQLRVASGEKLPKRQDELSINGHAIEARLYAENPAMGFLPSVGRLEHFDLGDEGRIETGVEEGDAISPFYDPMIAKLVARGGDREEAIGELASILDEVEVWPVKTNAGFLFNALLYPGFGTGEIDTGFIERNLAGLLPPDEPDEYLWRGAAMVALAEADEEYGDLAGFRLNAASHRRAALALKGQVETVSPDDGEIAAVSGFADGERVVAFYEGQAYEFDLSSRGSVGAAAGDGAILAPMPGKVTSVEVSKGEKVAKGQRLLTVEAMKMEHGLVAPFDGVVAELNAKAGAQVQVDAVLAVIVAEEK